MPQIDSLPPDAEYDFLVLGGGSAGYAGARTAASLGLRTLVIEGGKEVGGLCILRGCMPSKAVIESANRMISLRRAAEFGLRAENIRAVPEEILARKRRLIGEFADYRRLQLESGRFDFLRGCAHFEDAHVLAVTSLDGRSLGRVRAHAALVATGSRIPEPLIPGLREAGYLTSDDALELDRIPESLVVLGAGAIALEAAHHLAGLGARVTVINRGAQILRAADADVAEALQRAMEHRGVIFHLGTRLLRVERLADGKRCVHFADADGAERTAEGDDILFALGREPNTATLGLEHVPEARVEKSRLLADPSQCAGPPLLFAAGDVCGPHEIVHLAIQQGEMAARNAARRLGRLATAEEQMDYRLKLFGLFTQPQVGMVGLTEREAREAGLDVASASYPFDDHGKSLVLGETEGFVKLIAERAGGRLVGAAVVGPEASELIHEIVVAMHFRATARDVANIPHYHPTLSEIWQYPAEDLAPLSREGGDAAPTLAMPVTH